MEQFKETFRQKNVADYHAYVELKKLNYSKDDIAKHMSYSIEQLDNLIADFGK